MTKRYKHNLSDYRLLTCDMGQLVPVGLKEVLPRDTFKHQTNVLARVSPLAAPVMHPVTVRVHHFFVPFRLIWNQNTGDAGTWEDFITGGPDGNDANVVPKLTSTGVAKDLFDYLGIPVVAGIEVSALPIRAYNLIYNEFYRDQDLVPERTLNDTTIPLIAWEKDYFTSARPWTQKGDMVQLPLGSKAPITGLGTNTQTFGPGGSNSYETMGSAVTAYTNEQRTDTGVLVVEEDPQNPGFPGIYADLANALGANINDVRRAFAIQRFQEARARYGSRYVEYLKYLGAHPADARLQRPEFLGGGRSTISFSEVLQTAPDSGTPTREFGVSDMYGHGISAMRSNSYRATFQENGLQLSLLSVRPKTMYMQAVDRMWLRTYKEDFFQRELQFIGQQAIENAEIYGGHTDPKGTFGYQDRYSEYRHTNSSVSGEFRDTLNYWHMARNLTSEPALNQSFIDCNPTKRIHNEQTMNSLWVMCQHRCMARRIVDRSAYPKIF